MGNSVSLSVSNVSTTSLYAVGTLHNNGRTYGSTRFTLSCNGTNFVDWSTSIPYGQNVSWSGWYNFSSSTSARTFTVVARWDSSGFGYVDNNSASQNISIPAAAPSVTTPPAITNASLALNTSTNVLSGSWTTNGSGSSAPNNVIVDVGVDDSWLQNYNGSVKNSHTYSGEDNHKYQFRMSSGNSAGRSSTVYTNIKYTKPAAPTVKNVVVTNTPGDVATLQFNIDTSAINYPSSDKFEWRYKYDGSYYGPSGSTSSWFSSTTKNINVSSSDSTADSTLISCLKACKDGANTIAIQARAYNTDNSLVSASSADSTASNSTIKQIYINIPEGETLKTVYLNMPDGWIHPQVRDDVYLIQSYTTHNAKVLPAGTEITNAGGINGPWFVKNGVLGYSMQSPSDICISGMVDSNYKQLAVNNPNALGGFKAIHVSGRTGTSMTISFIASSNKIYSTNVVLPENGEFDFSMDVAINSIIGKGLTDNNTSIMDINITEISSQADITFTFPIVQMTSIWNGYLNI